eukprot:1143698-Pelagomonas_calceolata.AAC.7
MGTAGTAQVLAWTTKQALQWAIPAAGSWYGSRGHVIKVMPDDYLRGHVEDYLDRPAGDGNDGAIDNCMYVAKERAKALLLRSVCPKSEQRDAIIPFHACGHHAHTKSQKALLTHKVTENLTFWQAHEGLHTHEVTKSLAC